MKVWAMSDLHLALGTPEKSMSRLFPSWHEYEQRIATAWDSVVALDDLVLIAGDISWAMRLDQIGPDFAYLAKRPGIKVLIRGNHDYWWESASKVRKALPEGIHIIQNDVFSISSVSIAGARLWDSQEYTFDSIIDFRENSSAKEKEELDSEKIFLRELGRLEMSLKAIPKEAKLKIAMTHYPPIGLSLEPSRVSRLFEQYGIQYAIFGHLHSLKPISEPLFGTARGVTYKLTSADWLNFQPLCIAQV